MQTYFAAIYKQNILAIWRLLEFYSVCQLTELQKIRLTNCDITQFSVWILIYECLRMKGSVKKAQVLTNMAKHAGVTKLTYILPIYKLDKTGKTDKTD